MKGEWGLEEQIIKQRGSFFSASAALLLLINILDISKQSINDPHEQEIKFPTSVFISYISSGLFEKM